VSVGESVGVLVSGGVSVDVSVGAIDESEGLVVESDGVVDVSGGGVGNWLDVVPNNIGWC